MSNDTVIYLEAHLFNINDNILKRKARKGVKAIGRYEDGNLIEVIIYDENGNIIDSHFKLTL